MTLLASAAGDAALFALLALEIVCVFVCTPINVLKGKYGMAVLSLLGAFVVALPAAIRLAKPNSWWARRLYDGHKRTQAVERFAPTPLAAPQPTYAGTPDPFANARGGSLADRSWRPKR